MRAQSLGFAVEMKHPAYVVGEPVLAAVTIENHGFRPVNITDFGPFKDNRLFFEISRTPQVYLKQRREGKIINICSMMSEYFPPMRQISSFKLPSASFISVELRPYEGGSGSFLSDRVE